MLYSTANLCNLTVSPLPFPERRAPLKPVKVPISNRNYSDEIGRHLKAGQLRKAVSTLDLATRNGSYGLDLLTYSILLKNCIRSKSFHLGELVHENFTRSGLLPDSAFLNSLISLHSKSGEWEKALEIFQNMGSWRDLVSWSAMISCFATNGMELKAICTYVEMLGHEVFPNEYCYTAIIKACSNRNYFIFGEAVFASVMKTGHLGSDVCVGCGLIDMFVHGGDDVECAYDVFQRMPERNVVSWTLMITRFQQLGYCEDAIMVFLDMVSSGFVPDEFTLSGVISACADLRCIWLGRQLHSLVIKSGFSSDVCVGCSLIDMYSNCSQDDPFTNSLKVFTSLPVQNVMSWTAIISGCVQNGYDVEAIRLFLRMMESHVLPNHFTFSGVLKACIDASELSLGEQIFACAMKLGLASASCVGNSVVSLYAQCGDMQCARNMLDTLFERNLVSYNTNSNNSKFEETSETAKSENIGSDVNAFTLASLLSGAASVGSIGKGEQIHCKIMKSRLKLNIQILNALISMYSRCGNIEAAHQVFEEMECKNVVSWTSMVTGFAKHGLAFRALETFQKMEEAGVKPNTVTYVAVLSACSHVGLVSEGKKHFESMKMKHGLIPRAEHYACMVDLLGRSGCLLEAMEFINNMPIEADVLVLKTFLGACQVHGNANLGKMAAKMLLEQNPDDPAAYVLLSNIYASTGQWKEVADIRKRMKERHLTKQAGCSWLEVENAVHKFYVGDTAHPRAVEIYKELEQLALELKDLGYVPNTDFVLHDVEEEQKEQFLFHHSEKLAVSFGLISTSESKPIRIFKNLRVCGDCHSAMKYISIARRREIIVRDSTRFHHFRDGKCSCNDYW